MVTARDDDATRPNNDVHYVMEAGSRDHFTVDPHTGHVTVAAGADWPAGGGQYDVTVAARDGGCPTLAARYHLNITVRTDHEDPV